MWSAATGILLELKDSFYFYYQKSSTPIEPTWLRDVMWKQSLGRFF